MCSQLASESYSPGFAFEKILRVIEHMAGVVAPPVHVDDENFLTVRLLRKWNSNIADLSIELQSLFEDRFGMV